MDSVRVIMKSNRGDCPIVREYPDAVYNIGGHGHLTVEAFGIPIAEFPAGEWAGVELYERGDS